MELLKSVEQLPKTDDEAMRALPDDAHGLYRAKRGNDKSVIDAFRETLEVYLGIESSQKSD